MCGIAGWLDWERDLSHSGMIIEKMIAPLIPRGPDAQGGWLSTHVCFGHTRLAVVDIEGGKQPMIRTRDGYDYTITYNGELYNTEELRQELLTKGYQFRGHSDTEVLLVAYMEWGYACLEKLNGIFAFGIWDSKKQTLFLARDRLGVKPLFYYQGANSLIFASELKGLLAHPEIPAEVDQEGLTEIFMLFPARTPGHGIFKNIKELKPGYMLWQNRDTMSVQSYWQLPEAEHEDDFQTTVEKVRFLVTDAISRQLVADVPVGTLLSGGLDSSIITAIAAKSLREQKNQQLATFSVDFTGNSQYFRPNDFQPDPDAPWVTKMSEEFQTCHHAILFDTCDLLDSLEDAVVARDLPGMADIDSSLLLFSRKIKEKVTVGISGECADEIFGGYPWFHRPDLLHAPTFPWSVHLDSRLQIISPALAASISPLEYVQERYEQALREIPAPPTVVHGTDNSQQQLQQQISYLTLTRFMPTLLDRKDRMTMAAGLEVRVPFCDHRLVEYAWNIPWEMKNYRNREKGLLRLALEGLLPEDILWRKKSPYPKTYNPQFLAGLQQQLLTVMNDSSSLLPSLINPQTIKHLLANNQTAQANTPWFGQLMDSTRLLAFLLQVDFWLRRYKIRLV